MSSARVSERRTVAGLDLQRLPWELNPRPASLCSLAGIEPGMGVETGREGPWEPEALRRTHARYHDEHVPESWVEILGHSIGRITYRHYAHRAPLAFRAITTLPQPTAFQA